MWHHHECRERADQACMMGPPAGGPCRLRCTSGGAHHTSADTVALQGPLPVPSVHCTAAANVLSGTHRRDGAAVGRFLEGLLRLLVDHLI